jgi:hypothetical protein
MRRPRSSTRDDVDRAKDALHKLRSENRKLRKENSQLRKELNRAVETEFDRSLQAEEETAASPLEAPATPEPEKKAACCPRCKSEDYFEIPAGRYLIKACKACGFRKRTESKVV